MKHLLPILVLLLAASGAAALARAQWRRGTFAPIVAWWRGASRLMRGFVLALVFTAVAYGSDKITVTEGWRRAKDGVRWWYEYADRTWAVGWVPLECSTGKHWFYFDKNGYMLTGWQKIDGDMYYLDETKGPDEGACWKSNGRGVQNVWTL